jgi:hypothetical protein
MCICPESRAFGFDQRRAITMAKKKATTAAKDLPKAREHRRDNELTAKPSKKKRGAPLNDQDPKRRLGNFEGAGEAPRRGSRTTGIGGQSKQKFKTDKKQA